MLGPLPGLTAIHSLSKKVVDSGPLAALVQTGKVIPPSVDLNTMISDRTAPEAGLNSPSDAW